MLPPALGLAATILLMAIFLGVRPNLLDLLTMPAFWLKVIFVAALACIGWTATKRLSLPGLQTNKVLALILVPLVVMWSIGAVSLLTAMPDERSGLFWGTTWRACPFLIAALSIPIFIAILRTMRELAPTRLRLAGASAGFTAGAAAATVYCLHCPEMAAPFVGFWYVLGIMLPTVLGILVGPRVLRW